MPTEELTPSTAVIVIDMQNDFCHDDGVHGKRGSNLSWAQAVVAPTAELVDEAHQLGVPVIFVRTHHDRWSDSERYYMRDSPEGLLHHVQPGGWGAEFYGRLAPNGDDYVLTKRRYSAFFGTELDVILRNLGIGKLIVAGVATNICVDTTVRDASQRDFDVVVVRDCVAAYSREAHDAALATIDGRFGRVVALEAAIKELATS